MLECSVADTSGKYSPWERLEALLFLPILGASKSDLAGESPRLCLDMWMAGLAMREEEGAGV